MKVLASRLVLPALLLIICTISHALDPPTLMWEREYFTDRYASFKHVIQTADGGFAVSAYVTGQTSGNRPVIKMDEDGNIEWYAGNVYYHQGTYWVIELPDSSYVATGTAIPQSGDPPALYLFKVDSDGTMLWNRIYNFTSESDAGNCVIQLPDGGFAICGKYDEYDALLMRTDANGDTLWTTIYDTGSAEKAFRVLYHDNGLTVYVDGGQANRPILCRYTMDGSLLWERTYGGIFPFPQDWGGDICLSSDIGYMIASPTLAHIAQTDWLGYLIWNKEIPGIDDRCGLSLNPTMDGGYIFSGWEGYLPPPSLTEFSPSLDVDETHDGWLVKLDSLGNAEWHIHNELGIPYGNYFNCARQLQSGGYIVAGRIGGYPVSINGYLLRYAPETGIEVSDPSPVTTLSAAPNPFSSSLNISYSLPEPAQIALSVYDLSGRVVEDLVSSPIAGGEYTATWSPSPGIPDGCYLIVLDAGGERVVNRAVLLR